MSSDPAGRSDSLDRGSPEPFRFELEFPQTMKRPEGPVWLIKGLLPATGLAVTYGPSGSGKSFLALDAALHIAGGRAWAGASGSPRPVWSTSRSEAGRGMRLRLPRRDRPSRFSSLASPSRSWSPRRISGIGTAMGRGSSPTSGRSCLPVSDRA